MIDEGMARSAEEFFHEKIPLTRAMGVRVLPNNERGFVVEAPVALNANHLQTGFGGSINAVATLAGYGCLWLELRADPAIHVVVAESSIRYLRPVRKTIRAICPALTRLELEAFKSALAAKGSARIALKVVVEEAGTRAAEFDGNFVAWKR
jgi:thioesterase domain-containing protein